MEGEPAIPASGRSQLGVIFLTLFLDLVGFSIIFPLFPGMLDYYFAKTPDGSALHSLIETLISVTGATDRADWRVQALFGGVLGSLYSLLQFLMSPFWEASPTASAGARCCCSR